MHPQANLLSKPSLTSGASQEVKLQVFLSDYERDRHIDAKEAVPLSLTDALTEFDRLSNTSGSFIGFRRADGSILQFIWNDDRLLDADVPDPSREGSFARSGTWRELRPLVPQFAAGRPIADLPGFYFHAF